MALGFNAKVLFVGKSLSFIDESAYVGLVRKKNESYQNGGSECRISLLCPAIDTPNMCKLLGSNWSLYTTCRKSLSTNHNRLFGNGTLFCSHKFPDIIEQAKYVCEVAITIQFFDCDPTTTRAVHTQLERVDRGLQATTILIEHRVHMMISLLVCIFYPPVNEVVARLLGDKVTVPAEM